MAEPVAARPVVVVGAHIPGLAIRVDAIPREGETVLGWDMREPEDGGKATNQAVAAARLGAAVRAITSLGDDERGETAIRVLERYGVDMTHVIRTVGPTDVGVIMLPPSRVPAIVSVLKGGVELDGAAVRRSAAAFEDASVVVCQLEAPVDCAVAAFELGRVADAINVLNTAPVRPLPDPLLDVTDILVANEHEAGALIEGVPELDRRSEALARLRPGLTAVVTAGAAGCYVAAGDGAWHIPAPRVRAVDTTGAGDAFIGALAAELRTGATLHDSVLVAVRAAALSVTRHGTMPAFPDRDELASFDGGALTWR